MSAKRGRLQPGSDAPHRGESARDLARGGGFHVEQVLSGTLEAPIGFEQDHDEWFVLVSGAARLAVSGEVWELAGGDWGFIPAGTKHTLLWTAPGTSWITVHGSRAAS